MRRISERMIQLRMPHQLHDQLAALATRDAATVSATIRRLLQRGLEREQESR